MASENFLVNYSRNREAVETIGEGFPKFDIETTFTFVIEAVYSVDRSTFVIS